MDGKDLVKRVKEDSVKFISLQFSDVTGAVKSVDMPVRHLEDALKDGVWFDGSSVEGFARIQESDMRLILDADTYAVLPWSSAESRRARVFCDIFTPKGDPFEGDPRGTLKRQLKRLEEKGWTYNIGPEPEFFLFKAENGGHGVHPVPHDAGGYFDFSSFDEAVVVRTALMDALDAMGLDVEVGHHEVALGQHEIDFRFANALRTADNVLTLKYTVKAIAAQHGLTASFMPKPVFGINGSGMHCHQSLFEIKSGNNLFFDNSDVAHLSKLAYSFIAGQLAHARALAAVVAPTVNSYKRLVPGYEAPVYVCWARRNRSALVRVPLFKRGKEESTRIEYRSPDPACNPYLAFAAMLSAGLAGIEGEYELPPEASNNIYVMTDEERRAAGIRSLPEDLYEAIRLASESKVLREGLGERVLEFLLRNKREEWDDYRSQVSPYELERYFPIL